MSERSGSNADVDRVVIQDFIDGIDIALHHLEGERMSRCKHRMGKRAERELELAITALKEAICSV